MSSSADILTQILLSVFHGPGSIDMDTNGIFSASDIIFANMLLRGTLQNQRFLDHPTTARITLLLEGLLLRDSGLFVWVEKEIRERGEAALAKHLWITYATMP